MHTGAIEFDDRAKSIRKTLFESSTAFVWFEFHWAIIRNIKDYEKSLLACKNQIIKRTIWSSITEYDTLEEGVIQKKHTRFLYTTLIFIGMYSNLDHVCESAIVLRSIAEIDQTQSLN